MLSKELTIKNEEGLQSRPAALLVQVAGKFMANIWIEQGSKRINSKSIMGVLSLRLKKGDSFFIVANGDDEVKAIDAIVHLIETGSPQQ
ncbi:MAG: HPr family phosphocarrier protein [Clostridiales bacterium]|nr:HPr family phosphocarrier protein [Clostridiales bacterium]